jgi:hypothetical protein
MKKTDPPDPDLKLKLNLNNFYYLHFINNYSTGYRGIVEQKEYVYM